MASDEVQLRLEAIRRTHIPETDSDVRDVDFGPAVEIGPYCSECDDEWPCEQGVLLAENARLTAALAARDAEVARYRTAVQDRQRYIHAELHGDKHGHPLGPWPLCERPTCSEASALLASGADAGADLTPMSPPAAYPATLEITDVRAGRPLPPDADDTRAAGEPAP